MKDIIHLLSILLLAAIICPGSARAADATGVQAEARPTAGRAGDRGPQAMEKAPVKKKAEKKTSKPINITADRMEADDKKKIVVFTGSVIARQDDVVMNCDLMRVYYEEAEDAPNKARKTAGASTGAGRAEPGAAQDPGDEDRTSSEIYQVDLVGNVRITKGDQVALAQKAVYLTRRTPRVFILTGEPRVWRNKDVLTGKKITLYLDEERSVVEGGSTQRVNATFYEKTQTLKKRPRERPGGSTGPPKHPGARPEESRGGAR